MNNARHLEAQEAEQSVLGSVMLDNSALDRVGASLDAGDFYAPKHACVWRAMLALAQAGEPIDVVTLVQHLEQRQEMAEAGGLDYVLSLTEASATAVNVEHHAGIVRDAADVRRMASAAHRIAIRASSGDYDSAAAFIDEAQQAVFDVGSDRGSQSMTALQPALMANIQAIQKAYESKAVVTGTPTGFTDLDEILSGFQPGTLNILAARPAMGKSAMAAAFAAATASIAGGSVAIFSLEMPAEEYSNRMLHAEARVDSRKSKSGHIGDGDIDRLLQSTKRMAGWSVHIDDCAAATVMNIRSGCRRIAADKSLPPLALVVIDYLQLMGGSGQSREQEVSGISRGLKNMAKELGVPVIALAQLNRGLESRTDKRPMLSDLRESGAIEQDADVVMFVYRDEVYNPETADAGIAELIVRKHRAGATGTVRLRWTPEWTRFDSLARGH